jgi:hypothetical protein
VTSPTRQIRRKKRPPARLRKNSITVS